MNPLSGIIAAGFATFFFIGTSVAPTQVFATESVNSVESVSIADQESLSFQTGSLSVQEMDDFSNSAPYVYGKTNAEFQIFEFSDTQCPYCRRSFQDRTVEKIVRASNGRVSLATSYFPLDFHVGAEDEAIAGICYGKLAGKAAFYDFRKKSLSRDIAISVVFSQSLYLSFAESYGIDASEFTACQNDPKVREDLTAAIKKASDLGVSGTPSYLIVQRRTGKYAMIVGAYPIATFVQAIKYLLR